MAYAEYLKNLLAPLGIYDLAKGSFSEAMVYAAGQALDQAERSLERTERESLVATALEEGLERRETLFARRPVAETVEDHRAAITALMQIDADSLTPEAINRTISGCGIPAKYQKQIFERFYRIPKGNRHDVKGYGLGLSYAKEIIERHGGSIRVSSQENKGSVFTLLIPQ